MLSRFLRARLPFSLLGLCLAILTAAALFLASRLLVSGESVLAARLRADLESLPPDAQAECVAALTKLGEPGLATLAELLGSPDESLSSRAFEQLQQTVRSWATAPTARAAPHVALLAEVLDEASAGENPRGVERSAQLAELLLDWPLDGAALEADQVVAHCDAILARYHQARRLFPELRRDLTAFDADLVAVTRSTSDVGNGDGDETTGQEIPPTLIPPAELAPRVAAAVPLAQPSPTIPPGPNPTLGPTPNPTATGAELKPASVVPAPTSVAPEAAALLPSPLRATDDVPLEPLADSELDAASDYDVMQRLRSRDSSLRALALRTLVERGFTAQQIEIAQTLVAERTEARRQLVRDLQHLPHDPLPWLLYLCRDPDPDVRGEAIAVLATATDPAIRDFLGRMQLSDPSPPVRRLIRNLLHPDRPGGQAATPAIE